MNLRQLYSICKNIIIASVVTFISVYVLKYTEIWYGKTNPLLIILAVITGIAIIIKSVLDYIDNR